MKEIDVDEERNIKHISEGERNRETEREKERWEGGEGDDKEVR